MNSSVLKLHDLIHVTWYKWVWSASNCKLTLKNMPYALYKSHSYYFHFTIFKQICSTNVSGINLGKNYEIAKTDTVHLLPSHAALLSWMWAGKKGMFRETFQFCIMHEQCLLIWIIMHGLIRRSWGTPVQRWNLTQSSWASQDYYGMKVLDRSIYICFVDTDEPGVEIYSSLSVQWTKLCPRHNHKSLWSLDEEWECWSE